MSAQQRARDEKWEEIFQSLCRFKTEHGHVCVPQGRAYEGHSLGNWVKEQRKLFCNQERGRVPVLRADRQNKLESIGFVFKAGLSPNERRGEALPAVDPPTAERLTRPELQGKYNQQWEENFQCLCRFKEEFGHTRVPFGREYEGRKLGQWVASQRALLKNRMKGKSPTLPVDPQKRLESIDFVWEAGKPVYSKLWEDNFQSLLRFKEANGHTNVPWDRQFEGRNLGHWVNSQRTLFRNRERGNAPMLQDDRQQRLDSIGFDFAPEHATGNLDAAWEDMFAGLKQFMATHGHHRIPQYYPHHGKNLRTWVAVQRRLYRNRASGKTPMLSVERLKALRSAGFDFEPRASQQNSIGTEPGVETMSTRTASSRENPPGQARQQSSGSAVPLHGGETQVTVGAAWEPVQTEVSDVHTVHRTEDDDMDTSDDSESMKGNDWSAETQISGSAPPGYSPVTDSSDEDDDSCTRLERAFLSNLDNEITMAEEEEFLNGLDLEIRLAEETERNTPALPSCVEYVSHTRYGGAEGPDPRDWCTVPEKRFRTLSDENTSPAPGFIKESVEGPKQTQKTR